MLSTQSAKQFHQRAAPDNFRPLWVVIFKQKFTYIIGNVETISDKEKCLCQMLTIMAARYSLEANEVSTQFEGGL